MITGSKPTLTGPLEQSNEVVSASLNNHLPNATKHRDGTWWKRRTPLERRLSLCAFTLVFVAIGLAIATTLVIYKSQYPKSIPNIIIQDDTGLSDHVCDTSGCVLAAAEILQNMDQSVDPCQDFYSFACGGFEKNNVIPDDRSSVSTYSLIDDKLTQQLQSLFEKPIKEEEAEPFKLVKKYYQSCLNKTMAEERGLQPLEEILKEFGGWPVVVGDSWDESSFEWIEILYKFNRFGYSINFLMSFYVTVDQKNSTARIIDLDEATLGISREYLVKSFDDKYVQAYLNYQIGLATLLGADRDKATKEQTFAVQFEIELAKITLPREERRDASKFYNPMTIKELSGKVPQIPWLTYINTILAPHHVLTEDERIVVDVPDYFLKLVDLLAKTPKRTMANYLLWRISKASVSYLNEAARNIQLEYSTVLSGTPERIPRWEECNGFVTGGIRNVVGAMYVREYFDESSRQSINEMVKDIRSVFIEMIDELDWMDDQTRLRAKEKATAMTTHIAYPVELLDDKKLTDLYENLTLNTPNYLLNVLDMYIEGKNYAFQQLRLPVNKTDWVSYGHPADVNAYYSFLDNSIQFPAGILQGAFFGKDRPAYLNYAAIGWVIGHEITHGFDDQGRQFGADGNLAEWWEPKTKEAFLEKAQCIIDQYGNYSFPELELNVNGINTQGENIADNGGLKEAYQAYIKWANRQNMGLGHWDQVEARLPGLKQFSPRQLFWISAANIWCEKSRPEDIKMLITTGQHTPSRFRVRGPFANMPQFASDFSCPFNKEMNPVNKCAVW